MICPKCKKEGKKIKMIESGFIDGTYYTHKCPICKYDTGNESYF